MAMEEKSASRANIVNEISALLSRSTQALTEIAKSLDWNDELFAGKECITCVQCPLNENHMFESSHLKKHVQKCHLRKLGVDFRKDMCQSSTFFYNPSSLVQVPASLSANGESDPVIPTELLQYYKSPEERLKAYDRVIEVTRSKRKARNENFEPEVGLTADQVQDERVKSKLEVLAEQRDYKRRRQSYRAKNVHITKRTPTDIMREIIENRMQELQSVIAEEPTTSSHSERT